MIAGSHLVEHKTMPEKRPAKLPPAFCNIVLNYFATKVFASLVDVGKATGRSMGKNCIGRILMFVSAMLVIPDPKNITFKKA